MDTDALRYFGVRYCRESVGGTADSIVCWTGNHSAGRAVLPLLAQAITPSVYDAAGNVIEMHEHAGGFKEL